MEDFVWITLENLILKRIFKLDIVYRTPDEWKKGAEFLLTANLLLCRVETTQSFCLLKWSLCQIIDYRVINSCWDSAEKQDRLHVTSHHSLLSFTPPVWCHQEGGAIGTNLQEQERKQTSRPKQCVWYWLSCVRRSLKKEMTVSFPLFHTSIWQHQQHHSCFTSPCLQEEHAVLLLVNVTNTSWNLSYAVRVGKKIQIPESFYRNVVSCGVSCDTSHGIKPSIVAPFRSQCPTSVELLPG